MLDTLPDFVSYEQVNAAGSFVCDLVSAQVQHFDLLQTSQVRSISQLSNPLISDVILAQIQYFQVGEELSAQHAMNGLNSLGFNRVLGEVKASKCRSEAILNSKTQMTQLPLVEAAFSQLQLIERWHDAVSQQWRICLRAAHALRGAPGALEAAAGAFAVRGVRGRVRGG